MQRIVVALDGSDHAEKALELGSDLAGKYGAEVVLLHVLSDRHLSDAERHMVETEHLDDLAKMPEMTGVLRADNPRGMLERLVQGTSMVTHRVRAALGRRLMESAERTARSRGATKIQTLVEEGEPAETILRVAEGHGADMIVMGSRGLGSARSLLMGSVSQKVGHLAPCTCVTVK